jgi:prolyl 4-hydroxylase
MKFISTISDEPVNENILSKDPHVATYNNMLSNEECQHFIDISRESLKRALASEDNKGVVSSGRTGSNTWIKHDHDEITQRVGERIAKIVGMPLENAEAFQVIYYGITQEYRQHYDSWVHDGSDKTHRCMNKGGARMKTALCYLNDVTKGGGTKMTKLDITISAEKGKLLVFHNTVSNIDHTRHKLSEHAGLPVEEGEKYAFNLWFRECNSKMLYKDFNPSYYSVEDEVTEKKELEDETESIILNITEKSVDLLPETLQVGDYIPFIEINGEGRKKHMHNYCNNKPFMFVTIKNLNDIDLHETFLNLSNNFDVIVLFEEGNPINTGTNVLYTKDVQLKNILMVGDEYQVYITSPNRRIISVMDSDELREMKEFNIEDYLPKEVHIPYLLIENALDNDLLKKVINFYNQKKIEGKLISHQHSTKDRLHVHPDAELEKELDHKISRSVLPELRKVFYFDAQYRELYKICSYDAETSGRFHPHRDTPAPYQHRKYALSLFLNDDYEGGEFVLPEYGLKVKPKANTAFIFPGISTHQVLPVTKGSRMTIISFFVNGSIKPQYKMKAHYYKDKKIVDSQIYPL